MITFKVDNVKHGTFDGKYMRTEKRTIRGLVGTGVEASSLTEDGVMVSTHNLLSAVNTAYDQHLPLVLSPDMIWLTISQGLSTHITNNAEKLRSQFVNFEGKQELIVYENGFRKGNPNNNWSHMFGQFSDKISEYIGKKRNLIVNSFSTTGPVELAASEVVLMESMSKYFDYTCRTCCGIPEITLLGTVQDWQDILTRVQNISEFDLAWWTQKLEPIVQEFVNAAKGNANAVFWQKIYKEGGRSGGPFISGWITDLFPYLMDHKTSDFTRRNEFKNPHGLTIDAFPVGMAKVPFKWEYFSTVYKMELAAGFTGFRMEDGSLKPQIGWFVRDTELMADLQVSFKRGKGWEENDKLRKTFVSQLEALGFEESGHGWGESIIGSIPKDNLETAKQINGLTFSESK